MTLPQVFCRTKYDVKNIILSFEALQNYSKIERINFSCSADK